MSRENQIRYAVDQLIGSGNLDIIEDVFSVNYLAHADNKEFRGHDFIKKFSKQLRSAIPDISVVSVEVFIENDKVISWQRTLQGTHNANMMGIPPSGKKIKWNEMVISRFEENKITEEWIVSELVGQLLLKQSIKK